MVTVEMDEAYVERRLLAGEISCPGCRGVLAGWGHARSRVVRGPTGDLRLTPRRARCRSCRSTHVLLPRELLCRRADTVDVIGAAIVAHAAGAGHRPIAVVLGRPAATVRGWLRRLAGRLEAVRGWFTAVVVDVQVDPVPPEPAQSAWADLVTAVEAAASAVAVRFEPAQGHRPVGWVWRAASAMSSGRLLAPWWPVVSTGARLV